MIQSSSGDDSDTSMQATWVRQLTVAAREHEAQIIMADPARDAGEQQRIAAGGGAGASARCATAAPTRDRQGTIDCW